MKRKYTYRSTTSPEISAREKEHFERTRALAGDCTVLLRNDGALPIPCAEQKIALYGEGGRNTVRGGTGSGMTYARHDYSVEEALETAGFTVTTKAGSTVRTQGGSRNSMTSWSGCGRKPAPVWN